MIVHVFSLHLWNWSGGVRPEPMNVAAPTNMTFSSYTLGVQPVHHDVASLRHNPGLLNFLFFSSQAKLAGKEVFLSPTALVWFRYRCCTCFIRRVGGNPFFSLSLLYRIFCVRLKLYIPVSTCLRRL